MIDLAPGTELDLWLAEHAARFRRADDMPDISATGETVVVCYKDHVIYSVPEYFDYFHRWCHSYTRWSPTKNRDQALEVVEHLNVPYGIGRSYCDDGIYQYYCRIGSGTNEYVRHIDLDMAMAICRAVVAWLERGAA